MPGEQEKAAPDAPQRHLIQLWWHGGCGGQESAPGGVVGFSSCGWWLQRLVGKHGLTAFQLIGVPID